MTRSSKAAVAAVALLASASLLTACGNREREAEVNTGTAQAEVSTTLPESQVSDAQLKAAAEGAAAVAETPQGSNTAVVVTPPSDSSGVTTAPAGAAPPR
ncbi:hypothetical protein LRS10_13445 [Phenylobacterium sp. J426]|uniref:hypothetical protein n=1 Tax=Phenylobacterium sp. J426 TaxID=2898439 RepID=UPI002151F08E|nr:hypothetical protein [Phenylobacterium sp. J426]MCR5875099.1 hypothetical protein [Phenylobacterium sp. J426]